MSQFGNGASTTGLATLWAIQGSSATKLALILALPALPSLLITPFVGAAVERTALRPFLVVANVALGLVALAIAWAAGQPLHQQQFALLVLLFTLKEVGNRAFAAGYARAFGALAPATTGRPVVLADLSSQAGSALGAAVGGLVALQGGTQVFVIDAATFVVAGLITCCLPLPGRSPRLPGESPQLVRDVTVAVEHVLQDGRVLRLFCAYCTMSLTWAAWDVVGAYLFTAAGSPAAAGTANAAAQIGKMLTGVWLLGLSLDFSVNKVLLASLVLAFTGIVAGAVGLTGPGVYAVTGLVLLRTVFGSSAYLGGGGAYTLMVYNAPEALRARLATLVGSVATGLVAGSAKIGVGALNDAAGPALAFLLPGLLGAALSLLLCRFELRAQHRELLGVELTLRLYWAQHAGGLTVAADRDVCARLTRT